MTSKRPSVRPFAVALAFAAAACLSSAPPAPPVRWFDPSPAVAPATGATAANVRVVGAGHLGRDFAVRVGERELAFDAEHRWIAEPQQIVAAVLARALAERAAPQEGAVVAELELFELDVTAAPQAHVRVHLRGKSGAAVHSIDVWAPAADRSPASFAAAMANALAEVAAAARSGS